MKIALLCNLRPAHASLGNSDDTFEEHDSEETIESIRAALRGLGVMVEAVAADRDLPARLENGGYDFAFNVAEGTGRRCREGIAVAVCELVGLPFTGSDMLTLGITLDKSVARRVVSPEVTVARGFLVENRADHADLAALRYPVLVKPNDEGSSKGIRDSPIAFDMAGAVERCARLQECYGCPVLVEEFLGGPEVTIGVAGNGREARVIGMMEIASPCDDRSFVYSLEVKRDWLRRARYHQPPRLSGETIAALERSALTSYRLLGCRDIARFDFRFDMGGQAHFLECNPLPGLNPSSGDIVILSQATLSYEKLVQGILIDAVHRVERSCGNATALSGVHRKECHEARENRKARKSFLHSIPKNLLRAT